MMKMLKLIMVVIENLYNLSVSTRSVDRSSTCVYIHNTHWLYKEDNNITKGIQLF